MNLGLRALLEGLTFRTATPDYEAGETLEVYVTGLDAGGVRVRIGDTVLLCPTRTRRWWTHWSGSESRRSTPRPTRAPQNSSK